MKFITAVVMLAFAVATHGSIIPLPYATSLGYSLPAIIPAAGSLDGTWTSGPLIARYTAIAPTHAIHAAAAAPIIAAPALAPAATIIAAPVSGSYVAANRGAVHTAPLPGHAQSASSINLAPAPGTW